MHSESSESYAAKIRKIEQTKGANHSSLLLLFYNLGLLLRQEDKPSEAARALTQAKKLADQHFGVDSLECTKCLGALASCLKDEGRPNEAIQLLRRSLEILERRLGSFHLDLCPVLDRLVEEYTDERDFGAAYTLCERSAGIAEVMFGSSHAETTIRLERLARLLERQGRHDEATPLRLYAARSLEDSQSNTDYMPALASSLDATRLNRQSKPCEQGYGVHAGWRDTMWPESWTKLLRQNLAWILAIAGGVLVGEYFGWIGAVLVSPA